MRIAKQEFGPCIMTLFSLYQSYSNFQCFINKLANLVQGFHLFPRRYESWEFLSTVADLSFHFPICIYIMIPTYDYSLDSDRENAILILPSARLHIWQIRSSKETLSHFSVTTTNLDRADLTFAIATIFAKLLMLRNFWKLQLNINISSGNWYDFWYLNMIVELSAYE